MTKIFHKRRHNLLKEGSQDSGNPDKTILQRSATRRYIKYAIGEIVLVVIGILIALQIHNWNENRINKIKEIKYLESIRYDLIEQNNILSQLINDQNVYRSNADKALDLMVTKTYPEHLDSLYLLLLNCSTTRTFSVIGTTYEDLKSTGNFQIIRNDEIKKRIIKIYMILYEEEKISSKNNPIIEDFFGKYIRHNELGFYNDKNGMISNDNFKNPRVVFTLISLLKIRSGFAGNRINKMIIIQNKLVELIEQLH